MGKHRLVPIVRDPNAADTRTGWRCVWCRKTWGEIDVNAWFEQCEGAQVGQQG